MNSGTDFLNEYEESKKQTSRHFNVLLFLMLAFIVYINIDIFLLRNDFDWMEILLGLVIPLAGCVLMIYRIKAGWFICSVFYTVFLLAILSNVILDMTDGEPSVINDEVVFRQLFILSELLAISILLWSRPVRKELKTGRAILLSSVFLILILATLAIIAIAADY